MKATGIFIFIAVVVSLLSPFHPSISLAQSDGEEVILTLDVCNASGQSFSSNYDSPSLHEPPCIHGAHELTGYCSVSDPAFHSYTVVRQDERPPRS